MKLSVPMRMSLGLRMVIVLSKASATAQLKTSMLFPNLTWLILNRPRRIVSKRIRSKLAEIVGASKQKGALHNEHQSERQPS